MKTLSFVLILLLLSNLNSCKDREIEPDDLPREYTLKGKLLNGTTMEPLYPGLWLNLKVSDISALPSPKFETIGSCQVQRDGSFELKYTHNKLAQSLSASMRLESSFYISPTLPRNQDVDTTLYKSSWGSVKIIIKDISPLNNIYWAYRSNDSLKFFIVEKGKTSEMDLKYPLPTFGVYYDSIPLEYDSSSNAIRGNAKVKGVQLTGDPYVDELTVEY